MDADNTYIYIHINQFTFSDRFHQVIYTSSYIQNRAARIIAGASYEIPSADVLETLGWEALEVRRKRNKAILMYRILNNQGASSLKESFTRFSALEINYNLRNSSTDLLLPHPKREFLKNSFKFSGARLWNSLPLQAKLSESEYTFKMNINSLDT